MLPFFDLCDHRSELSVVWEALGNETISFRFGSGGEDEEEEEGKEATAARAGQPIHNNYGPKGNQELLFAYGFALEDNPFDSVEGIVFG